MTVNRAERLELNGHNVSIWINAKSTPPADGLLYAPDGDRVTCKSASYGDSLLSVGCYDPGVFSFVAYQDEWRSHGLQQDQSIGDVLVRYYHPDIGEDSDILADCKIKAMHVIEPVGDESLQIRICCKPSCILWGERRVSLESGDNVPAIKAAHERWGEVAQ